MRSRTLLLIVTALVELGAGLTLLVAPSLATWLLLGIERPTAEALVVGEVCGAGLLAISVACWSARSDRGSASQRGLLWGVLVYDVGAAAVLGYAGMTLQSIGVGLWPAVALHTGLAIWCLACIRLEATRT